MKHKLRPLPPPSSDLAAPLPTVEDIEVAAIKHIFLERTCISDSADELCDLYGIYGVHARGHIWDRVYKKIMILRCRVERLT